MLKPLILKHMHSQYDAVFEFQALILPLPRINALPSFLFTSFQYFQVVDSYLEIGMQITYALSLNLSFACN